MLDFLLFLKFIIFVILLIFGLGFVIIKFFTDRQQPNLLKHTFVLNEEI